MAAALSNAVQPHVAVTGPTLIQPQQMAVVAGPGSTSIVPNTRSLSAAGSKAVVNGTTTSSANPCSTLFVANLGHSCTEFELTDVFGRFVKIYVSVKVWLRFNGDQANMFLSKLKERIDEFNWSQLL
jgi:hypothetical protein